MKETALQALVCPESGSNLELEVRAREGREIMEGSLTSKAGLRYPIIGGVPRMLPPTLLSHLRLDYPDFARRHPDLLPPPESSSTDVQRHTQEAFGYEWTWAGDYDADNFEDWLPEGFTAEGLFGGRSGLEVGCGAGRHAYATSGLAREHFAVDLSRAVDSAFTRNRERSNCHVVQADAFRLPFSPGFFEYVYCLGVLQHMHDPPAGFRYLAQQPKEGGVLLVNVYQSSRPVQLFLLEILRKLTIRMSNSNLRRLSTLLGALDYGLLIWPWKGIRGAAIGSRLRVLVPARIDEYAKHSYRTCVVDWFDRLSCPVKMHYSRAQLESWYLDEGYEEIAVTPYWQAFWNGYGRRRSLSHSGNGEVAKTGAATRGQ